MRALKIIKEWFQIPFYPILLAVYPILYLAGNNLSVISLIEPIRPTILTIVGTLLFLVYFKVILKSWHRAALLTTFSSVLFFSFGHFENKIPALPSATAAGIYLILFLGISFLILRIQHPENFTFFLNGISVALMVIVLLPISSLWISREKATIQSNYYTALLAEKRNESIAEKSATNPIQSPDIIYIVLDSYEGKDGLQKYYHFDNSEFINELQHRGFYVAAHSRSNYMTTTYTLSSVLNLVYINDLPKNLFSEMISRLRVNHVADFLHQHNYQYVQFPSGYALTDDTRPDVWVSSSLRAQPPSFFQPSLSNFETLLLKTTMVRMVVPHQKKTKGDVETQGFFSLNREFDERRSRIQNAFDHLPDYVSATQPRFIFAHVILPHNPYLYDAAGNPYAYNGHEELLGDQKNSQNNIRLYLDQLLYTNNKILETIDSILQKAENPPIIILMGDHGHDTFFNFEHPNPEGVDLRSSILYAVYFPDQDYQSLYPNITPVNTFRILFNKYFHTKYSLLPDKSYLHPRPSPNSINSLQQFFPIDSYLDLLPAP